MFFSIHLFFSLNVDEQCIQYLLNQHGHIPGDSPSVKSVPHCRKLSLFAPLQKQEISGIQIFCFYLSSSPTLLASCLFFQNAIFLSFFAVHVF